MRRATLLVIGTAGGQVTAPTAIPGLTGVTDLTPGPAHVLALRSDHTVWSWGERLRDGHRRRWQGVDECQRGTVT